MKRIVLSLVVVFILAAMSTFWMTWHRLWAPDSFSTDSIGASSIDGAEDPLLHVDSMDKGYLAFPVRIIGRSTMEALSFDPRRGKPARISYKLTRDGEIRIRVCWRKGKSPILRTLLDWTHQEFGPHEVQWDGRDASGNLIDNTRCFIDFQGDDPKHKNHESTKCHELALKIVSPAEREAVIRQLSEVRLKLADDRAYGEDNGYQLRAYVDYQLVANADLEKDVRTFSLPDVEDLSPGPHLITVNVDDRHDHIGVAGLRVDVQR